MYALLFILYVRPLQESHLIWSYPSFKLRCKQGTYEVWLPYKASVISHFNSIILSLFFNQILVLRARSKSLVQPISTCFLAHSKIKIRSFPQGARESSKKIKPQTSAKGSGLNLFFFLTRTRSWTDYHERYFSFQQKILKWSLLKCQEFRWVFFNHNLGVSLKSPTWLKMGYIRWSKKNKLRYISIVLGENTALFVIYKWLFLGSPQPQH